MRVTTGVVVIPTAGVKYRSCKVADSRDSGELRLAQWAVCANQEPAAEQVITIGVVMPRDALRMLENLAAVREALSG
jgi:hypothetical protein